MGGRLIVPYRRGWRPGAIGKSVVKLMKFKVPYQGAGHAKGGQRGKAGSKIGKKQQGRQQRQGGRDGGGSGTGGSGGGGGGAQGGQAKAGGQGGGSQGGGGQGGGQGGGAGGGKDRGGGGIGGAGGGQGGTGSPGVGGGERTVGFTNGRDGKGDRLPYGGYHPDEDDYKKRGEIDYYGDIDPYFGYDPEDLLEPKPTLKIHRKGDIYTIAVNPLKDLTDLQEHEDPYVDCEPMVFKIIKKRDPEEQAKADAYRLERERKRRDQEIRNALRDAADDICRCVYMDIYCNDLTALDHEMEKCPALDGPECTCKSESMSSVSSNASWDIEYTPPFGCFDLRPRKRLEVTHTETQYSLEDAGVERDKKCKKKKSKCFSKKASKKAIKGRK